jgi:drug/metabolite transporter (DMT)-like permease
MAIPLALLAALLFALAGAAEQRAASRVIGPSASAGRAAAGDAAWQRLGWARRAGHRGRRGLWLAGRLLHNPLWISGWAADGLGFAAQARAIHAGSLSVVQPVLVTTLLFSLPLAAAGSRSRLRWSDWAGGMATCAGLALVLSGRREAAAPAVHQPRLMVMVALLVAAAGGLALAGRARLARGRAVPLAVAAGVMFALGAAFTKLVTDSLATRGVAETAAYWPSYALIVVSASGLVLQQAAFTAGSLPATMTALTITDPLLSYALGVGGFGEQAPLGAGRLAFGVAGVGLAIAGIGLLARSPLLRAGPAGTGGAAPGAPAADAGPVPATAARPVPAVAAAAAGLARTVPPPRRGPHPVPAPVLLAAAVPPPAHIPPAVVPWPDALSAPATAAVPAPAAVPPGNPASPRAPVPRGPAPERWPAWSPSATAGTAALNLTSGNNNLSKR